jgi:hypothetical protein
MKPVDDGTDMISVADFPQWAADRIANLEAATAALLGRATAQQYALMLIMGRHPELRSDWQHIAIDVTDAEMDGKLFAKPAYRESYQRTMASLAQVLTGGPPGGD